MNMMIDLCGAALERAILDHLVEAEYKGTSECPDCEAYAIITDIFDGVENGRMKDFVMAALGQVDWERIEQHFNVEYVKPEPELEPTVEESVDTEAIFAAIDSMEPEQLAAIGTTIHEKMKKVYLRSQGEG
jgi:hypothetical protein